MSSVLRELLAELDCFLRRKRLKRFDTAAQGAHGSTVFAWDLSELNIGRVQPRFHPLNIAWLLTLLVEFRVLPDPGQPQRERIGTGRNAEAEHSFLPGT